MTAIEFVRVFAKLDSIRFVQLLANLYRTWRIQRARQPEKLVVDAQRSETHRYEHFPRPTQRGGDIYAHK